MVSDHERQQGQGDEGNLTALLCAAGPISRCDRVDGNSANLDVKTLLSLH